MKDFSTTDSAGNLLSPLLLRNAELPGGSATKNPPASQETRVRSLDWEDPLEKEMATHSSILARRIPWTKEPGRLQSVGLQNRR